MNRTVEQVIALYRAGAEAARNLKPGDEFKGAWGHAADAGITDLTERSVFTSGFLTALDENYPNGVLCDANSGRIKATRRADPAACLAMP